MIGWIDNCMNVQFQMIYIPNKVDDECMLCIVANFILHTYRHECMLHSYRLNEHMLTTSVINSNRAVKLSVFTHILYLRFESFFNRFVYFVCLKGPSRLRLSKPLIAAVSGYAVAGGLELALLADLRIVEGSAIFGVFCRRFGKILLA